MLANTFAVICEQEEGAVVVCSFFGHKDTPSIVFSQLKKCIEHLIISRGVNSFMVGNQGSFDGMVLKALRELKQKYPHICYSVALAYMPGKGQKYELYSQTETFLPEGIENVPRRFAISHRNKWMVKESDIVVCYITHLWGGAAQFAEYAQRQGKEVINLAGSDVQIGTGNGLPRRLSSGSQ
ncbi:MAG: hypothetical protein J6C41_04655 [Oscillospiraceae bacterium]|nr:hypothetical protein [Oscillospiraceae bacterium]